MDPWPVAKGHQELLDSIHHEWNLAEADIKIAEQVCREAVIPAINELRYAGRRIVEAISCLNDPAKSERAADLLRDAKFDCHRARHDAIDATILHITLSLDVIVQNLGSEIVLSQFHEMTHLWDYLNTIQDKVVNSRKNRENREAVYAVIESDEFPKIVAIYRRLQVAEPVMRGIAVKQRKERLRNSVFGYVGVLAFLFAVASYFVPAEAIVAFFQPAHSAATAPSHQSQEPEKPKSARPQNPG